MKRTMLVLVFSALGAVAFWIDRLIFSPPHDWANVIIPICMILGAEAWRHRNVKNGSR